MVLGCNLHSSIKIEP